MYSFIDARSSSQSEADSAGPAMEVDQEDVFTNPNPCTPTKPVSVSRTNQLAISSSFDDMSQQLGNSIRVKNTDGQIKRDLPIVWFIVHNFLTKITPEKEKPHLASGDEFQENVMRKGEKAFIGLLRDMAGKSSWDELPENDVFLKENVGDPAQIVWEPGLDSQVASLRAWSSPFKGKVAEVLLKTISNYLDKARVNTYTRHSSIVNSSGTGKSRIVDEVATKIVTVPMCLREEGSQGFPPPDIELRTFLISLANPNEPVEATKKLHGFMTSLLSVLLDRLNVIGRGFQDIVFLETADGVKKCQALLASKFRDLMTKGQAFQSSNQYRQDFYKEVIEKAANFAKESKFSDDPTDDLDSPPRYTLNNQVGVKEAGKKLCQFIDPHGLLDSMKGPRWPLVILAFDESHSIADIPKWGKWTVFSELRRTLRGIVKEPIFTLFLSTAGKFHPFSPEIRSDPSSRVTNSTLRALNPISETSFDDLAYPAEEGTISLDRVVQTDWISHLGRPLFGAYYDALAGDDDALFLFAKSKLLDCRTSLIKGDDSGSLACLSVRFALKFNEDATSRDIACTQVERHMRLCLAATTGFERLITLAGSEPLLAEAASQLMYGSVNPVHLLANHSDLNCIDRGGRGELVAELIIMQARDAALSGDGDKRWMSVSDFIQALLPQPAYETLQSSLPTFWRDGEEMPFTDMFEHYAMWFNHVIRVDDSKMINSKFLWMFIMRGAMISCTHNQQGVDIILPVCRKDQRLSPHTVTAILIQVKNAEKYGCNIVKTLFDGMNPLLLGLFNNNSQRMPVIRMVFALASEVPGVLFPPRRERQYQCRCQRDNKFTTFDIWCAGVLSFKNIGDDLDAYQILLDRSLQPHDAFTLEEMKDEHLDKDTKKDRGGLRRRMAPLTMTDDNHWQIYAKREVLG